MGPGGSLSIPTTSTPAMLWPLSPAPMTASSRACPAMLTPFPSQTAACKSCPCWGQSPGSPEKAPCPAWTQCRKGGLPLQPCVWAPCSALVAGHGLEPPRQAVWGLRRGGHGSCAELSPVQGLLLQGALQPLKQWCSFSPSSSSSSREALHSMFYAGVTDRSCEPWLQGLLTVWPPGLLFSL